MSRGRERKFHPTSVEALLGEVQAARRWIFNGGSLTRSLRETDAEVRRYKSLCNWFTHRAVPAYRFLLTEDGRLSFWGPLLHKPVASHRPRRLRFHQFNWVREKLRYGAGRRMYDPNTGRLYREGLLVDEPSEVMTVQATVIKTERPALVLEHEYAPEGRTDFLGSEETRYRILRGWAAEDPVAAVEAVLSGLTADRRAEAFLELATPEQIVGRLTALLKDIETERAAAAERESLLREDAQNLARKATELEERVHELEGQSQVQTVAAASGLRGFFSRGPR